MTQQHSSHSPQASAPAHLFDRPASSGGYESLGLEFLLYGIQSPINIGMMMRSAEAFLFAISILDLHGVLDDPARSSTLSDFACGAKTRMPLRRLEDPADVSRIRGGRRLVATSIGRNAVPLSDFCFAPGDLIALGNEYDGLPDDLVASADVLLHVPTPAVWLPKERSRSPIDASRTASVNRDGQPSLNVAMTAGIICYAAYAAWLAKHPCDGTPAAVPNR